MSGTETSWLPGSIIDKAQGRGRDPPKALELLSTSVEQKYESTALWEAESARNGCVYALTRYVYIHLSGLASLLSSELPEHRQHPPHSHTHTRAQ